MAKENMQVEWRKYRDACYPDGIGAQQNKECHQAFFSGALVIAKHILEIAVNEKTDEAAETKVRKLFTEVSSTIAEIVKTQNQRN